jgi:hypothetical protein
MMKGSKIASKATYHKCIKELQRLGFLDYQPSFNPYSGTLVFVHNLSEGYIEKPIIEEKTNSNNDPTTPFLNQANQKMNLLMVMLLNRLMNCLIYIIINKHLKTIKT